MTDRASPKKNDELNQQLDDLKSALMAEEESILQADCEKIEGARKVLGLIKRVRAAGQRQRTHDDAFIETPRQQATIDSQGLDHDQNAILENATEFLTEEPKSIGRFKIIERLGVGGYGLVFLARDPDLGRDVALKIPRPEVVFSPALKMRFLREAKAAATLAHPNIVPVFEVGSAGPVCFIAYQLVRGLSLATWFKERKQKPVNDRSAAHLISSLAEAVHHAHQRGVLHRDLKPANILLQVKKGESRSKDELLESTNLSLDQLTPLITDFGMAKFANAEDARESEIEETKEDAIVGTPAYMSPEQTGIPGKQIVEASDVYALGAILFELVTGQLPFSAESVLATLQKVRLESPADPRRINPALSKDLAAICLKCLEKDPADRYASSFELKADLDRFLAGHSIKARPVSTVTRLKRWYTNNPLLSVSLTTTVAAILIGFIASTVLWARADYLRNLAETKGSELEQQKVELESRTEQLETKSGQLNAAIRGLFLDIANSEEIKSPEAAELREAMLVRANHFYQMLVDEKPKDDVARENYSETLFELAKVRLYLGDPEGALALAHEAVVILADCTGNSTELELVNLHKFAAARLNQLGRFDEALAQTQTAINIAEKMELTTSRSHQDLPENAQLVGALLANQAELEIRKKEYSKALKITDDARKMFERLNGFDDNRLNNDELYDIALCQWIRGRSFDGLGEHQEAEECLGKAANILQQITQREIAFQCHVHLKLGVCLYEKGVCHSRQNEVEMAKECYRQAMEQFKSLPETLDLQLAKQGEFHRVSYSIAVAEMLSGNYTEAEDAVSDLIQRTRSSIENLPQERATLLDRLGDCLNLLYVIRSRSTERSDKEAEVALREAIESYRRCLLEQPGWDEPAMALVQAQINLGNVLFRQQKIEDADEQYEISESLLSEYLQSRPEWVKVKSNMRNLQHGLMQVNLERKRYDQALQHCRQAQDFLPPNAPKNFLLDEALIHAKLQHWDDAKKCLQTYANANAVSATLMYELISKTMEIKDIAAGTEHETQFVELAVSFFELSLAKQPDEKLKQLIEQNDQLSELLTQLPQSPK